MPVSKPISAEAPASAKPRLESRSESVTQLVHAMRSGVKVKTKPEKAFWDKQATNLVQAALGLGKDTVLFASLDILWEQDPEAYEQLADLIENCVQSTENADGSVSLLIAIPVLAWSRSHLPSGKTDTHTIEQLKQALRSRWLADGVSLHMAHTLYSPDALPDGFSATFKLAKKLFANAALGNDTPHARTRASDADEPFLSDSRFWLAVLTAPAGEPMFQAQLSAAGEIDLEEQTAAWRPVAANATRMQFIGTAYDVMPPEGYYEANRSAELEIRGFSLHASALMMMTTLEMGPDMLRAVVAACHSTQFEEYRISLLAKDSHAVLQGITWPLLGRTETQDDLLLEIKAQLAALGIQRVKFIDEPLSMEYCDDCATPLFPDQHAELVHPSAPEEDEDGSPHRPHVIH